MDKNYCSCGCGREIGVKSRWAKGHNPNKTKDRFDWSNLEGDYKTLGNTKKVAEKYSCSHEAVSYQMKKRNIKFNELRFEIDNIHELYERHRSIIKVAEVVGCSLATVRERLYETGHKFTHDNKSLNVEVGLGRYGERIALSLLNNSKDMNDIKIHYPYDVEWNGQKIDVKTSKKHKRQRGKPVFSFSTKNTHCDFYLLIALNDDDFPIKFLYVPRKAIVGVSVTFTDGIESKWDKFKMEVNDYELRKTVQIAKRVG